MALKPIQSFCFLFHKFIRAFTFQSFRFLFTLVQSLWWKINGTQQQIQQNRDTKTRIWNRCAQVVRIHTWNKFCMLRPTTLKTFIYSHETFVHPEYVLENDHVVLAFFDLEADEAVFCEGEPGQLLWRSSFHFVVSWSILYHGKKLIRMPMSVFNELAERMTDSKSKLILLTNVGRCGSSLLAQVFEKTEKIVTLSEPFVLNTAAVMYHRKGITKEVVTFTRNIIRMLCKPLDSFQDPIAYAIKPSGPAIELVLVIKKLYPEAITFFLYRDLENSAHSAFHCSWTVPSTRLFYILGRTSEKVIRDLYLSVDLPPPSHTQVFQDDFTFGFFLALGTLDIVRKKFSDISKLFIICYDDIIKDPELATKALFKLCGLPMNLVEDAMKAYDMDSQINSILSIETLKKVPKLTVSEADRVRASTLLVKFGYPPLCQPLRMDGTIDFEQVLNK